jgi:hypothetical protein
VRRTERGFDVAVRDDEGRIETMVTVTPIDGDEEQAEEIAELVRDEYQTTDDVFDVEGKSRDGDGGVRPVPPGVDNPTEGDDV